MAKMSLFYKNPLRFKKSGPIRVVAYGEDQVQNKSEGLPIQIFNDEDKPEVFIRFSNESIGSKEIEGQDYDVYPTNTMVFISATDKHSGVSDIKYQINGNELTVLKEAWVPLSKEGIYQFQVFASDRVKNQSTKTFKLMIKNPDLRAH